MFAIAISTSVGHVRCVNILIWLLGFQDKLGGPLGVEGQNELKTCSGR